MKGAAQAELHKSASEIRRKE